MKYPMLTVQLPDAVCLAISGGQDSVAVFKFFRERLHRRCKMEYFVHVNHNTEHAAEAERYCRDLAFQYDVPIKVYTLDEALTTEAEWSRARRDIYEAQRLPVVVAHHLDDAVTWYVMQVFKGNLGPSKYMPPTRGNVLRPFMLWTKDDLWQYFCASAVYYTYVEDPTNSDPGLCTRNAIAVVLAHDALPFEAHPIHHVRKTYKRYVSNAFRFPHNADPVLRASRC